MASCSFVADGRWRARRGLEPVICAEVQKEYAERLAAAKWGAKVLVWREMERELNRRIEAKAPGDALY